MKIFSPSSRLVNSRSNSDSVQRVHQPLKAIVDNRPSAIAQRKLQEAINDLSGVSQLMVKSIIQREKTKCNECNNVMEGTQSKCSKKTCKSDDVTTFEEEQGFGAWWAGLGNARRQELLRAHGSHEDTGGATRKFQGGGNKGNQHSDGVARAMKQIKIKYNAGQYN